MINDEANNCYYFAVKNLSELKSSRWLRDRDADFEDALDDALNYQTIEKKPQGISKIKPDINKYNWKGIESLAGPKEWVKFEKNNNTIAFNVLYIPRNT